MDKTLLIQSEEKLKKEGEAVEKELKKFAEKDKNLKGDWDTRFPKWDVDSGGSSMERAADQVEEYGNLLSLEYNLETRLKEINLALDKIKKGIFGKCENCEKEIKKERLKIYPAARFCIKCEKK